METEPRPLANDERAVLEHLLSVSFPGVEDLRQQLRAVRVVGRCDCGCPTIYLGTRDDADPGSKGALAPVEGRIDGAEPQAEVLLFVRNGLLTALEYVYYDDQPPTGWPAPAAISLIEIPR